MIQWREQQLQPVVGGVVMMDEESAVFWELRWSRSLSAPKRDRVDVDPGIPPPQLIDASLDGAAAAAGCGECRRDGRGGRGADP